MNTSQLEAVVRLKNATDGITCLWACTEGQLPEVMQKAREWIAQHSEYPVENWVLEVSRPGMAPSYPPFP